MLVLTLALAIYYIFLAWYLQHIGYYNQETLFYIEKAKIVFQATGSRLKVMGLTAPIFPFFATFIFTPVSYVLAPVFASAVGTAVLFNIMAGAFIQRINNQYYVIILLLIFMLHPGMLYVACSGKSFYLILTFFFLFFYNIFKYYESNTTFHVSIASICLVVLVFCDYKFIWLTLFFIPLVLLISIQSLNLSEKESIFRMFTSFNNSSLRRKLINKTFALYIILFILPLVSVIIYKILNLTHAADLNYFIESPYATWSVLAEKMDYNVLLDNNTHHNLPETSVITSLRIILFCPLILVGIFLFRKKTYQVLTLLTPFACVEFLRVKYDKVYLTQQYYLIFLMLALLCIILKAGTIRNQLNFKIMLALIVLLQLYTGWAFLDKSNITEEQKFIQVLLHKQVPEDQKDNQDIAAFINNLPGNPRLLMDDAVAYPIGAFVKNVDGLILPYEGNFLSGMEAPGRYASYILVATEGNPANGYTQLNNRYLQMLHKENSSLALDKMFETDNWMLYRVGQHYKQ